MVIVGNWNAHVINHLSNDFVRVGIRSEVEKLCGKFGFY